jgi:ribose transport system permease protein
MEEIPKDRRMAMSGTAAKRAAAQPGKDPAVPLARLAMDRARALSLALGLLRVGPILILLVLIVVLGCLTPVFLTSRNVGNILAQTAVIATVAMGQHLVILTRGIDLSVGSTLALASVVGARTFQGVDSSLLVILAMIATGAIVGSVNGIVYPTDACRIRSSSPWRR